MADTNRLTPNAEYFLEHARTYHRFTMLIKWVMITLASVIVFLTLFTSANVSFFPALIVGLIIFGLGSYAMRHGLSHSSEEGSAPPELRGQLERFEAE